MSHSTLVFVTYIFLLLANFFFTLTVQATDNETGADESVTSYNIDDDDSELCPDTPPVTPQADENFFSFLDGPREYVSNGVELMAKNMDEFFSDEKITYDTSGSILKLRQKYLWEDHSSIRSTSNVSFKLRLPYTEKKMSLFFETNRENEQYSATPVQAENTAVASNQESDYIAGVHADLGEKYEWKFKPTLGVNLDSSLDTFARFRLSRDFKFVNWSIYWHEMPYWYNSFGWGFDSYFELNRKINEDTLFRSSTFAGWRNDTDQYDLNQVFTLYHTINPKTAMSYYAGVYGVSEPAVHTTYFLLGATFRQNIHKDYLFLDIVPQIRYQKVKRFHPEHSVVLQLEMVFKK